MATVSDTLRSIQCSQRVGSLDTRDLTVSGSDQGPPFADAVLGDELQPDHEVAGDEVGQLVEERLSAMLAVELLGVGQGQLRHLQIADEEPVLFDGVDDFSDVIVSVGFDHGEGPTDGEEGGREM